MPHIEYIKNGAVFSAVKGKRIPFGVRFLDKDNQPIAGAFIRFFLERGGGILVHLDNSVSPSPLLMSITDCKGEASIYYESDGVAGNPSVRTTVMEVYSIDE